MPFDYDAFLADVLAKVPEDQRAGVEEALKQEALQKEIAAGFSRQSDYSRKMDELNAAREEAAAALEAEKQRYTDWYADTNAKYQEAVAAAERYEAEYGPLDAGDPTQPTRHQEEQNMFTKEQLAAEFERRDRLAIDFADTLTDIKLDFRERFGERLDTKALYAHLEKVRLPLEAGYKDFIAPRVEEAREKKFEEQLTQAREEGAREARANLDMPVRRDTSNPTVSALGQEVPSTSADRVAAAVTAWRQAQSGA